MAEDSHVSQTSGTWKCICLDPELCMRLCPEDLFYLLGCRHLICMESLDTLFNYSKLKLLIISRLPPQDGANTGRGQQNMQEMKPKKHHPSRLKKHFYRHCPVSELHKPMGECAELLPVE